VSTFSTFVAGDTTITASNITASSLTLGAGGNITIALTQDMTSLNAQGDGTFKLVAGGNIYLLKSTSTTPGAGFKGSIGTVLLPFTSNFTLQAGGSIDLENNVIVGGNRTLTLAANDTFTFANGTPVTGQATGGITLRGNYIVHSGGNASASGVDLYVLGGNTSGVNQSLNGQEFSANGTMSLMNSGVIFVAAGTSDAGSSAGARIRVNTVLIGTDGGSSNAKRIVVLGGTNSLGYATNDKLDTNADVRQANGLIEAFQNAEEEGGEMFIYLRSDPLAPNLGGLSPELYALAGPTSVQIVGGSATAASSSGPTLYVTSIAGIRAESLVLVANGSVVIVGGNSTLNTTATSGALAVSTALINANNEKRIVTLNGGSIILQGGTATWVAGGKPNVQANAQIDPSNLELDVDGNLVLLGGIANTPGALANARVSAGNLIDIKIHGNTGFDYDYTNPLLGQVSIPGGLILVGGSGSGIFDSQNVELNGSAPPVTLTFTGGGQYNRIFDAGRGLGVIQTGVDTFDESLLNYIIFAANEETKAARIRLGVGAGADLGAPACQ
jgi:hypothetical protein